MKTMDINIHDIFKKIGEARGVTDKRVCGLCGNLDIEDGYARFAILPVGNVCSICYRTLENEVRFIEKLQELRGQTMKNMFTSDQDDFIMVSDE